MHADSEVELVVFPPRRSFYELLSEQWTGGGGEEAAVARWVTANLTGSEREMLRLLRGPFGMFRQGEALALMPDRFLR